VTVTRQTADVPVWLGSAIFRAATPWSEKSGSCGESSRKAGRFEHQQEPFHPPDQERPKAKHVLLNAIAISRQRRSTMAGPRARRNSRRSRLTRDVRSGYSVSDHLTDHNMSDKHIGRDPFARTGLSGMPGLTSDLRQFDSLSDWLGHSVENGHKLFSSAQARMEIHSVAFREHGMRPLGSDLVAMRSDTVEDRNLRVKQLRWVPRSSEICEYSSEDVLEPAFEARRIMVKRSAERGKGWCSNGSDFLCAKGRITESASV
jgi:hypothetical protein